MNLNGCYKKILMKIIYYITYHSNFFSTVGHAIFFTLNYCCVVETWKTQ